MKSLIPISNRRPRVVQTLGVILLFLGFVLETSALSQESTGIRRVPYRLPGGTRWRFHLESQKQTNPVLLGGTGLSSVRIVLDGELILAEVPFNSEFERRFELLTGVRPTPTNMREKLTEMEERFLQLLSRAVSEESARPEFIRFTNELAAINKELAKGVTGSATGTLTWSQTESSVQIGPGPVYVRCDALPTRMFQVSTSVRGWYDVSGVTLGFTQSPSAISEEIPDDGIVVERTMSCRGYIGGVINRAYSYDSTPKETFSAPALDKISYKSEAQTGQFSILGTQRTDIITLTGECDYSTSPETRFPVIVVTNLPDVVPDNSLSINQISRMGSKPPPPGYSRLGFTPADPQLPTPELEVATVSANFGNRSCLWVESLRMTVSLPFRMYIAREYSPGSCPYNALLWHENKHVEAYRRTLDTLAERVKRVLLDADDIPDRGLPIVTEAPQASHDRIKVRVTDLLASAYRQYRLELVEATDALDTTEEYARVRAMCPSSSW